MDAINMTANHITHGFSSEPDQRPGAAVAVSSVEAPAPYMHPNFSATSTNTAGNLPAFFPEGRMRDVAYLFTQAIEAAGLPSPAEINADGKLHRFSTSENKRNDDAGWYVLHDGAMPSGVFGCWRSGFKSEWSSKRDRDLTPVERALHKEQNKSAYRQRDAEKGSIHEKAVSTAVERLSKSKPVISHPYLAAKNVKPNGIAAEGNLLVIPIHDNNGKVHSLQTIDPFGKKRFLAGGKITGHYFAVGVPDMCIVVCEGIGTGLTIHECTGVAIAVAFSAANLAAVSQALRRKYPDVRIIVAADDDWATPGNPGRAAAKLAALAVDGRVALPIFPAGRPEGATDFNDLHRIAGSDAVVACFVDVWGR